MMMDASILMTNVGQCDGDMGIFQAPEGQTKFSVNGTDMDDFCRTAVLSLRKAISTVGRHTNFFVY